MKYEPAFPHHEVYHNGAFGVHEPRDGMTLRDWFASHASEEDIAAHENYIVNGNQFTHSRERAKYAYADAMLKAKEGNP